MLKAVSKALAMLDMIAEPDPWLRYYSYHPAWGPAEDLASMQDGSGGEYSIVFLHDGAAYARGFDHESPVSPWGNDGELWPGLIDGLPERFVKYVREPAFGCDGTPDMTVCLWTESDTAGSWEHGSVPSPGGPGDQSGAETLFHLVSRPEPGQYRAWAGSYYGIDIETAAIADIYASRPLDQELVSRINPGRMLSEMLDELRQAGYPVSE
ncbi:MAG: hypothetical protein ACRDOB_06485 [Streptosporangiaceae bacterium]